LYYDESPSANAEYEVKGKDGVLHFVEILSVPYYKGNEIIGFQGIARDITERKKASDALRLAKEKAEASDKLKTAFLNNISHEVRTPLNGILGFAEIISRSDLSENEINDSLSMLNESSDRLLNTMTNYMDISLLTSGNMSVHKKNFVPANYSGINLKITARNVQTGSWNCSCKFRNIQKIYKSIQIRKYSVKYYFIF
jgi:signal transduction histidine kinase